MELWKTISGDTTGLTCPRFPQELGEIGFMPESSSHFTWIKNKIIKILSNTDLQNEK